MMEKMELDAKPKLSKRYIISIYCQALVSPSELRPICADIQQLYTENGDLDSLLIVASINDDVRLPLGMLCFGERV